MDQTTAKRLFNARNRFGISEEDVLIEGIKHFEMLDEMGAEMERVTNAETDGE